MIAVLRPHRQSTSSATRGREWTTLFATVGRTFSPKLVKGPGWFDKSTWTTNQQKAFREFLINAAMQDLGKTKPAAARLANRFVRDYGWKVEDSMQAAVERGAEARKELKAAEGGAINGKRAAHLLRTTEAAVRRRRRQHRVVAWQKGDRWFYPKWQFSGRGMLAGIEEILQVFRSDDQWRLMLYFLSKRHSLQQKRPLDLLRAGRVAEVLEHAKLHAQENTW